MANCNFVTAEQHWHYCQRKNLFPELKNHGAVQSAQATTTKQSGVTTEKLLHWHGTADNTLNELDHLNLSSTKIDSFGGNMEETYMPAHDE